MRPFAMAVVLLMTIPCAAGWTPPEKPDPNEILREAEADTQAGRYEDALAKHVWFHQHALEYQPSMAGVRLSFALGSWLELAKAFPAAREKLIGARDQAKADFLAANVMDAFPLFHDFAAINHALKQESLTGQLFLQLDQEASPKAKIVFDVSRPALIRGKEYQVCLKYMDPAKSYQRSVEMFRRHKELSKRPGMQEMLEFGKSQITNDLATLVSLLVVAKRIPEAEAIVAKAKQEIDLVSLHSALDQAMMGQVPAPWPE